MSYRVFWSPHAEQRLEEILQDPTSQAQIAAAARDIDLISQLRSNRVWRVAI